MDDIQQQKKNGTPSSNKFAKAAESDRSSTSNPGSSPPSPAQEDYVELSTPKNIKRRQSQGSSSRKKRKTMELELIAAEFPATVIGETLDVIKSEHKMVLRSSLKKDQNQQKENPFENDLVVYQLMRFMSTSEVSKCRSVSRLWNTNGTTHLRRRHVLQLYPDQFAAFCKSIEQTNELPFSRLRLDGFYFFPHEHWSKFFRTFGPKLKTIVLTDSFSPTEISEEQELEAREKLRMLLLTAVNLVSLTCRDIKNRIFLDNFILSEDEVTTHRLPNLRSLSTDVGGPFYSSEFWDGLVKVVPRVNMLETGDWLRDTEDVWSPFLPLTLERLVVSNLNPADLSGFKKFLDKQSGTLKILKMGQNCHTQLARLNLPVMSKLLIFEFKGCTHKGNADFLFNVLYPQQLPCVKSIKICLDCVEVGFANTVFSTVEELIIDESDFNPSHAMTIANLGYTFPNLKKLINKYTFLKHDSIGEIFSSFHNLEELELRIFETHLDKDINNVLSGYPEDEVQLIGSCEASPRIPLPQNSIQEMKNLKKLILHFNTEGADFDFLIDETGVELGLLKIKPLLQLSLNGSFALSDELINRLADYHHNVAITFGLDSITRFYCVGTKCGSSSSIR